MSADGNGHIRPDDEFDTERVEDVDSRFRHGILELRFTPADDVA